MIATIRHSELVPYNWAINGVTSSENFTIDRARILNTIKDKLGSFKGGLRRPYVSVSIAT